MLNANLVGPVVVLQPRMANIPARVLVTYKLMFTDGSNAVVSAPTRKLWAGGDGTAFDVDPKSYWQIVARNSRGGIFH